MVGFEDYFIFVEVQENNYYEVGGLKLFCFENQLFLDLQLIRQRRYERRRP